MESPDNIKLISKKRQKRERKRITFRIGAKWRGIGEEVRYAERPAVGIVFLVRLVCIALHCIGLLCIAVCIEILVRLGFQRKTCNKEK